MNYLDNQIPVISSAGRSKTPDLRPLSRVIAQSEQLIRIPYNPRDVFQPYHNRKQRFAIIVAHRRCGKTVAEVNEAIKRVMSINRPMPHPPQAAFISPTYAQGKRNAWLYAKHYVQKIPGCKISEAELTITFPNRGKYIFMGSDNFESLRGMYLDHASFDEFGLQDPRVWGDVVRHTLNDWKGSATFIGSAKGRNHFWDLLMRHKNDPKWYVSILKASETGLVPQEELDDALATTSNEQFQQEYECNFEAAVKGAYYGKDMSLAEAEGRITNVPYNKAYPVFACWDIGVADHMALWTFQIVGQEWHWLNYFSDYNEDFTHYVDWANNLPYKIKTHFLPHDAKQRSPETAKTHISFLEDLDLNCEMVPKIASVNDGIHAVRMVLNRCWFDRKGTDPGVDCMRMYESEWKDDDKVLSLRPKHNWASHGADALRTGVMGIEERQKNANKEEERYAGSENWMG